MLSFTILHQYQSGGEPVREEQKHFRNLISEIRILKVLILIVLMVTNWVEALLDAKLV